MICAYLNPGHDVDEELGVENTHCHSLAIFAFVPNFLYVVLPGWDPVGCVSGT